MTGMLRHFTDENFNNDITRGLRLRDPRLDIIRIQDTEIAGAADPEVLAWAARIGRIVLTHDRATMPDFAYARLAAGEPMTGLFVINHRMSVRQAIEELTLGMH
jgi:predicted nuclease of predicted toxin-antitoxin system